MEGTIDADTQNLIQQTAKLQMENAELRKSCENLKQESKQERERRILECGVLDEIIDKLIDKLARR